MIPLVAIAKHEASEALADMRAEDARKRGDEVALRAALEEKRAAAFAKFLARIAHNQSTGVPSYFERER